ncbi:haloacid dehalogenase superfamily, subfamily IA, variant 1 with third motif having Dx(3-4)D or Dx(3-4)E [Anaerobranca californiensis DSM 14826]|uniref:Haloacid dehalogenase superfamily, subfamily IA, variant 1 with third motif having Dx(3-4)D or Dx(3-4)E n=1 Tax=Anaerobranca californiensis DSM 14826 TaxID=1120989 RepID=A0A1M6MJ46_9FIRM|nr:HAD family hydrolase [Anaerobranca californiensis]SHJ83426.1 haloacid dehalogenase superfamily, subfamily IA, variant 1 with third motif having Dx(3-4)D or Dx(3-4)E [Anaerobranca californiensis DSM 14826]
MFKAILFDLDGTLLQLDVNEFLPKYIKNLSYAVKEHIPLEIFPNKLLEATYVMVEDNNPDKTNEQVFMEHFFKITQGDPEKLRPIFDKFYVEDFPKLGANYTAVPGAKEVIKHCKEKGVKMVLATNPVFPKQAVLERIKWARLNPQDFQLITCYEEMHFCKPNLNFYREILDKIGATPHQTLMVGNDCQEDMVAAELGIKTFLVEGFIIDRGTPYHADYKGKLTDLIQLI